MSETAAAGPTDRATVIGRWVLAGTLLVWLSAWIWLARYHLLDDALIHLRYANFLWDQGELTFDGVESTYGASSLLYVFLLALTRGLTESALAVKVVSSVFYLALLALVVWQAIGAKGLPRALWTAMGLALISPMGVRWLTDGMETSLVAAVSVALPLVAYRAAASPASSAARYAALALFGGLLFMLRVEMGLLVAFASVGLWLQRLEASRGQSSPAPPRYRLATIAVRESHLLAGALAGALVVYLAFGQLLPDTAVAKSAGAVGLLDGLRNLASPIASSLTLGVGLSLTWATSALTALKATLEDKRGLWSLVAVNAVLLVLLVGIAVRGQQLAGFRNVMWALLFMSAWNILRVPRAFQIPGWLRDAVAWRTGKGKVVVAVALAGLVAAWAVEGYFVKRIVDDRSHALLDMRSHGLERLTGRPGVAFDIGFVAYFSQAAICDVHGLVNGREFARLTQPERAARCAERSPVFAFATPSQAAFVGRYVDMDSWTVCHRYLFTNFRVPEAHYLLIEPRLAQEICSQPSSKYGETPLE